MNGWTGTGRRRWAAGAGARVCLGSVLCVLVAGCHHKQVQPIVLPQQTPVALQPVEAPDTSAMIETPKPKLPPVPVAEAAAAPKLKKKRQKAVPAVAAPPAAESAPAVAAAPAPSPTNTQVAMGEGSLDATPIGTLTPGGEQSPQTQQEAADLIGANNKRLLALQGTKVKAQRPLIGQVRNFQRQAEQALRTGDVEGAKTLATKAKLLLDDLEKEPQTE